MIGRTKFLVPALAIGAALALSVQAQATVLNTDASDSGGHGAAQGESASGLRSLAATATHGEQPAAAATHGEQPAAAATHGEQSAAVTTHGEQPAAAVTHGEKPAAAPGEVHWTYDGQTGPANWGGLSADYHACQAGDTQSPIDLDAGIAAAADPIRFDYGVTPLALENNGHTVVSHYAPGSGMTIEGQRFELLQFHFHAPSEHRINGRPAVMEIHFVHKNAQGQLGVVGVMVEQGDENPALAEIWNHLPGQAGPAQGVAGVMINGRDLLPAQRAYYRYMGSLTTPPCSEGVNWFVMTTPIQASLVQVLRFAALVGPNNRPVQAVNSRLVLVPSSAN